MAQWDGAPVSEDMESAILSFPHECAGILGKYDTDVLDLNMKC